MKAEIIAIGTEVLMGQVVNSNAAYISKELSKIGVDVYYHTVVGDNPGRMKETINIAIDRSDVIIISGGLGPTKDDITKSIVAQTLGLDMHEDKESLNYIKRYYEKSNRTMPESNINQAMMIDGSQKIPNDKGMAPGVFLNHQDHIFAMVPGVPSEMETMVSKYLIDLLQEQVMEDGILESRTLRLYKITESQLAETIDDLIENQSNPTIAIYVDDFEPTIRISGKAKTEAQALEMIDQTEAEIREKIDSRIYGYGNQSIKDKAMEQIHELGLVFNIIESQAKQLFSNVFINAQDPTPVSKINTFKNEDTLKEYYDLTDLGKETIHQLLMQESQKGGANAAILVLGHKNPDSEAKGIDMIDIYIYSQGEFKEAQIDLSYRKVVDDGVFEVALMSRLYDEFK